MAKNLNVSKKKKVKVVKTEVKKSGSNLVRVIQKRDSRLVPFEVEKITNAIFKAMISTGEGSREEAEIVANKVYGDIVRISKTYKNFVPTVEGVQDTVEQQLILSGYVKVAKHYILYREERARIRATRTAPIPEHVRELARKSQKYFKNSLGEFVFYRSYARWIEEENRRETWLETVDRYMSFMKENLENKLKPSEYDELRQAILRQEVMPSMRLLQFAGPAARRTNVCAYNCSFIAPVKLEDFAEIMYISMCGTGVGFTVESRFVEQLPQIKKQTGKKLPISVIDDSKEGWCDALTTGIKTWYDGQDIDFDFSQLRPSGARLKTMGGRSSGPAPLQRLLSYTRSKILARQNKRLTTLDVHDIICTIGDIVVSGGVRRSALISLSDLDDEQLRNAKKGQFWVSEPQRALANNSAVYEEKPSTEVFLEEWLALVKSKSGERGIFNRGSLNKQLPERRLKLLGDRAYDLGTNPCGEIILQPKGFCNLSEVVARHGDSPASLVRKARLATILGTYQATLTNFGYLSDEWKKRAEEERLLGVSITGQWDCDTVRNAEVLQQMKKEVLKTNKVYAKRFGINESSCTTCVKPSGTVAQTVDSSSGIHPRHSQYYIRRIRISSTDSLFKMLKDQGVPFFPEVGQDSETANTFVLEFPVKSPENSVFKDSLSAIKQLEYWKMIKVNWCEHNPSATISVGENEWIEVGNWVYKNWEIIGGLSFLPRSDYVYQLAPYEEITKEKYQEFSERLAHIDYSKILAYEVTDNTEVKKELACSGGVCEIDDIMAREANKNAKKDKSF